MSNIQLAESYGWKIGPSGRPEKTCRGELEFIFKDVNGKPLHTIREHNIVKIFAKEIMSHRIAPDNVWDPNGGTGTGAWVVSGIDPLSEFAPKYIVFGAAFDGDHAPLDADPRYYHLDPATGVYVPNALGVGADYNGGLINAIPIAEPLRPLKRIERIYFEPSYQPAGSPIVQEDVRAINNRVVLETTLRKDEYNGFGQTTSDYFILTEVALVAGRELDNVGAPECDPHDLFLHGGSGRVSLAGRATSTSTITLDSSELANVDVIREGDQVKIVSRGGTDDTDAILGQTNPYYLVINKAVGGSDIILDRTPSDADLVPLNGDIGIFKDEFRIYSHRILSSRPKKSIDYEITVRWHILMS